VASAALFSRILGFARDMCMAWLLGGGPLADALTLALRLPNLARRLLGEGALSMSLTASFSGGLALTDGLSDAAARERLSRFAAALGLRLAVVFGCAVLLGEALAQPLMALLTPGLDAEFTARSAFLLRICLPYAFFAGLCALFMALLHSLRSFLPPSLSPAFFNLTVIAFTGLAALGFADPALLIALGVLCGGLVQCLIQAMALHGLGIRPLGVRPAALDEETRRELRRSLCRLPPSIFGAAAPQLSMLGAAALASWLPAGSMAALYYAERILEFPLGFAGSALGIASLPGLAALAAARRAPEMAREAGDALRLSFCISLPATAGLLATAEPLTRLLFLHGAFDDQALAATTLALCAYAPGLPAYAASRPLLALCNACNKTRLAGTSALVSIPCALAAGLLLLPFGVAGPALGLGLGLWTQAALLWFGLRRSGVKIPIPPTALARYAAGASLVFATARLGLFLLPDSPLSLMLVVLLTIAAYAFFLFALGDQDVPRLLKRT
jgi:putative peptidoglycan lipid II flippase